MVIRSSHQNIDARLNQVFPGCSANRREDGKMCWHPWSVFRKLDADPSQSPNVSGTFLAQVFRGHLRWQDYVSGPRSWVQENCLQIPSVFQRHTNEGTFFYWKLKQLGIWIGCLTERDTRKKNPVRTSGPVMSFACPRVFATLLAEDLKHSDRDSDSDHDSLWNGNSHLGAGGGGDNIHGYFSISRVTDQ